jgi:hypothetical protein
MARTGTAAFCLVLAGLAAAQDPGAEQLVFTGASAPGTNTLTFANNAYTFTFTGDETLQYQIDLSDPKVAGGMLRVKELTSDSYPIDGGGPGFRDAGGLVWVPESNYKKTTLSAHSASGTVLTLDFLLNFNGLHPFRYEIGAQGKQLRIRVIDTGGSLVYADNFQGLAFGKSTGVESPVPIRMQGALAQPITMFRKETPEGTQHFFVANMLDMFQSNAADYRISGLTNPIMGPDSTTFSLDTLAEYRVLTDGTLAAPLDDTLILVVSSRIRDVLVDSTAPPTPYRNLLASRMFFSAPTTNWDSYQKMFDQYLSLGMYNLAGYFFLGWSASAIDPPSLHSVGPDWWPAVDPPGFEAALQAGTAMGAVLGAYMAFNCMPATAPPAVWDPSQVVKNGDGTQKTYFGLGHPLIGVEASGLHAQAESALLDAAGASLAYLDIQTYGSISKGPDGGHLDQDADSPWAKTMRDGYAAQKGWFEDLRDTFAGPLLGEGSIGTVNSNMEFLHHGYTDSVQRCINTAGGNSAANLPAGSPFAPTNCPSSPSTSGAWRRRAR